VMEQFYKVVDQNLASFHNPEFRYEIGTRARRIDTGTPKLCTSTVLHASREAPDAARYGRWPYRLLTVEGVPVVEQPDKAGFRQLYVTGEVDVALCFGPNGAAVVDVISTIESATAGQLRQLAAAWAAAGDAAWDAVWDTARAAVWYTARAAARAAARDAAEAAARAAAWAAAEAAAWSAAWDATWYTARAAAGDALKGALRGTAGDAARAAVVSDLVSHYGLEQHHIDTLMAPYVEVFGRPEWMNQ
jgi:hypothetical protein